MSVGENDASEYGDEAAVHGLGIDGIIPHDVRRYMAAPPIMSPPKRPAAVEISIT